MNIDSVVNKVIGYSICMCQYDKDFYIVDEIKLEV